MWVLPLDKSVGHWTGHFHLEMYFFSFPNASFITLPQRLGKSRSEFWPGPVVLLTGFKLPEVVWAVPAEMTMSLGSCARKIDGPTARPGQLEGPA